MQISFTNPCNNQLCKTVPHIGTGGELRYSLWVYSFILVFILKGYSLHLWRLYLKCKNNITIRYISYIPMLLSANMPFNQFNGSRVMKTGIKNIRTCMITGNYFLRRIALPNSVRNTKMSMTLLVVPKLRNYNRCFIWIVLYYDSMYISNVYMLLHRYNSEVT